MSKASWPYRPIEAKQDCLVHRDGYSIRTFRILQQAIDRLVERTMQNRLQASLSRIYLLDDVRVAVKVIELETFRATLRDVALGVVGEVPANS